MVYMLLVFWELGVASSILGEGEKKKPKKESNLTIVPDLLKNASELLLNLGKSK